MLRAAAGLSPPGSSQQQRRIPCHTQPLQCPCPLLLALLRGLPVRPAPTGTQGVALVASGSPWTKSPEGCTPHPRHSPLPSCSQPFAERAAFTPNLFFFFFFPQTLFSPPDSLQPAAAGRILPYPTPRWPHQGLGLGDPIPGARHQFGTATAAPLAQWRPRHAQHPAGQKRGSAGPKAAAPILPPRQGSSPTSPAPPQRQKVPCAFSALVAVHGAFPRAELLRGQKWGCFAVGMAAPARRRALL